MRNQSGSVDYERFLVKLGKKIALNTHLGFLGGLKEGSDGKETLYFADSQLEVIFHVVTMMPTDEDDEQQISKKKHVGNDHVNIIWSENFKEYR